MKKNWIRLLAVLLAAVMIFPAAAFAQGEGSDEEIAYTVYVGQTDTLPSPPAGTTHWLVIDSSDSQKTIVTTEGLKVTGVTAGWAKLRPMDEGSNTIPGKVYKVTVLEPVLKSITVKGPTTVDYFPGDKVKLDEITVTANYEGKDSEPVALSAVKITPDPSVPLVPSDVGEKKYTVTYNEKEDYFTVNVKPRVATSFIIRAEKTVFTEGESVSGVSIDVSYNYGDPSTVTSGFTITPSGSLKTSDTKFYVTYEGITREQPITVNPKSSGGGSGGGGSGETTGDYKAVIVYQPDKKDYKVGDKFDWTGTMIRIYKPDTNNNSVLYATLYGADLARYTDLEYTFKTADILGSGKTSIKCNFRVDGHKVEEFSITGLTVTAAKKTLDLSVKNHLISNIFVNMKRTAYPVGSTIALSDIEYIGGKDDNNSTVMLSPSDLSDYANTFSLEVLSVDRNGNTTRKSAAYKNKIESSDVYTNRYGDKVVYLRFYVDDDYLDFTVESGDSGVYVYYGSTLLGIYSELAQALEDVNDLDFKWGSSETKYSDTRKLTIKLGEDMKLGRYDGQIALNRDIDIDLNGHKLTVYSDVFVFLDKKIDVFKATIGNTATETGTLIYDNMPYDDLLIDKGESIVFQYTDDKNADLPGIYTLTVEEPKNGAVASNPGLSRENKVTVSHGHDATFTVTPDANYEIESVKVKSGNSSTATTVSTNSSTVYSVNSSGVATYTMKDIKGVATVTATFKAAKAEKPADTWENPFKDISSYASYFDAVKYVSQNGLMQGDDLGNFNPSQTMTRAQFVTTLGRMYLGTIYSTVAEKDAAMIRTYGTDSQFTDVSYSDGRISYAVPYIKWAESNGLVQGYGNGKFGPYDTITHQQMYIIMYRYAQSLAMKSINVSSVTLRASDADELGAGWLAAAKEGAIAAAKYAQQQNFLVSTTRIDPNGNALRYELATLLMQFSKNVLGRE